MLRVGVLLVIAIGTAHGDPIPVRWGEGYTGIPHELTGPKPTFRSGCRKCGVAERIAKPPAPYLAVQLANRDHDFRYEPVMIAIHVKRGWYYRILAEDGKDEWPHGEPRIDQTVAIESITERDVIAGGPPEIVVVTLTTSSIDRPRQLREVWVFTVIKGVVWSLNPIDGVEPATLLPNH